MSATSFASCGVIFSPRILSHVSDVSLQNCQIKIRFELTAARALSVSERERSPLGWIAAMLASMNAHVSLSSLAGSGIFDFSTTLPSRLVRGFFRTILKDSSEEWCLERKDFSGFPMISDNPFRFLEQGRGCGHHVHQNVHAILDTLGGQQIVQCNDIPPECNALLEKLRTT